MEKYGINEILKPFVEELNYLASVGITVRIQGANRSYTRC